MRILLPRFLTKLTIIPLIIYLSKLIIIVFIKIIMTEYVDILKIK